ncbi:hypothetical protein BDV95DRAFT_98742 [Massariosphaeria phaeospora]|uniref:Uncharacterized protein n=1 Tax=Massariosphaeria phaeospora TaxID=100035 RepID=A0A7C8M6V8_9PLEO|nr:hypothetical protein BDV95DRAFT_98742 [Massariosphaeria phaeospora]
MRWKISLTLVGLATLVSGDVINYGDMKQYDSRVKERPTLTGEAIWLSSSTDDGFDVVLSKDMQSKVNNILGSCGQDSNKCVNDVYNTLKDTTIEVDHKIDRRHFGHLLSKTLKGSTRVLRTFETIAEMLYTFWVMKSREQMGDSGFYLPAIAAANAAKASNATAVTLSAGGSIIATITPPPEPKAKLEGSAAPQITTATGGAPMIVMDKDLASRLNDFVAMSQPGLCNDGEKFDNEHPSRRRQSKLASMGHAICVAMGVISNSGMSGMFADLSMLEKGQYHLSLQDAVPAAQDALGIIKDFVTAYTPVLGLSSDEDFSLVLAALIFNNVINKASFQAQNVLSTDGALGHWGIDGNPSRTEPSCPDPAKMPVSTHTAICCWVSESR